MDIGSVLDAGKKLLDIANTIKNKDLYDQLASYIKKVTDLTKENATLENKILGLEKEISALKGKQEVAKQVKSREDAIITDDPNHPYCRPCWESKNRLFSLSPVIDGGECPQCRYIVRLTYFGEQTPEGGFSIRDEG